MTVGPQISLWKDEFTDPVSQLPAPGMHSEYVTVSEVTLDV